jgi:hypothetical protein
MLAGGSTPENVTRFLEIAQERNRPLSDLIFIALRRSTERKAPEEIQEAKQLFKECGVDWDKCVF